MRWGREGKILFWGGGKKEIPFLESQKKERIFPFFSFYSSNFASSFFQLQFSLFNRIG